MKDLGNYYFVAVTHKENLIRETELVVYMCIIFYSLQREIALPVWHHACSLELARVGHLGLFLTFYHLVHVSILPLKYQFKMTNSHKSKQDH